MFEIRKKFTFESAHQLAGLPPGHKCGRMHGHSYTAEIILQSDELDGRGFVVDYGDLKPFGNMIDDLFDHRCLNDIIEQPSAENLAKYFYDFCVQRWPETVAVRVSETEKTLAIYWPARARWAVVVRLLHEYVHGHATSEDAEMRVALRALVDTLDQWGGSSPGEILHRALKGD